MMSWAAMDLALSIENMKFTESSFRFGNATALRFLHEASMVSVGAIGRKFIK
jgi:hypothetical protein